MAAPIFVEMLGSDPTSGTMDPTTYSVRVQFNGPHGIAYPQNQPSVDSFDDTNRIQVIQQNLKQAKEDQLKTAVTIKSELDSKIHDMHSQYVKGGAGKKEGGIIHSVQILTGGSQGGAGERRLLSQSESNLRRLGEGSGSINI